jgi:hypothetical protein
LLRAWVSRVNQCEICQNVRNFCHCILPKWLDNVFSRCILVMDLTVSCFVLYHVIHNSILLI